MAGRCRFCGVTLSAEAEWHEECVSAPRSDGPPKPFPAHPMYGKRPMPFYTVS